MQADLGVGQSFLPPTVEKSPPASQPACQPVENIRNKHQELDSSEGWGRRGGEKEEPSLFANRGGRRARPCN